MIALNSRRPLFRNNPELRRAVNFAIDRRALVALLGNQTFSTADHFLTPAAPGYRHMRIYPPGGDLKTARALAKGHTRSGTAVIYASEIFPSVLAGAKLIQTSLRTIGIRAQIKTFPHGEFLRRLGTPGEPFDLANSIGFVSGYPDHTALNAMFHRRYLPPAGCCNFFGFDSPHYSRLLDRANRLSGIARFRLYGRLDVELSRDAAPAVPYLLPKTGILVSRRAGCHRFDRPLFDLASVCLVHR
jgi:peptide/nickel transport system substrate-binding protein